MKQQCDAFLLSHWSPQFIGGPNLAASCLPDGDLNGAWGADAGWMCDTYGPVPNNPSVTTCIGNWWYLNWKRCSTNQAYWQPTNQCLPVVEINNDPPKPPQVCSGNPVYPLVGLKREVLDTGWRLSHSDISLVYDSRSDHQSISVSSGSSSDTFPLKSVGGKSVGSAWGSSLHRSLLLQNGAMQLVKGPNAWRTYQGSTQDDFKASGDPADLVRYHMGYGDWWHYDPAANALEVYPNIGSDSIGTTPLQKVWFGSGGSLTYTYSDASTPSAIAPVAGLLIKVTDEFGRSIGFKYGSGDSATAKVRSIVGVDGLEIAILYSGESMSSLTWPDGSNKAFLYERADIPSALTGIVDENQKRYASFGYDSAGNATSTEHAGGVNRYVVSWAQPPARYRFDAVDSPNSANAVVRRTVNWTPPSGTQITDPNGATKNIGSTLINGVPQLTSQTQPAGSGCSASTSAQTYDANGNVASRDDFNGTRSCHANDLSRNLEAARVEGLSQNVTCSTVLPVSAALPASSRKVSTQWHSTWRLPVKVAEPGKITTSIYNGQPDPFNANTIASCAPSTTLLPDGKPIAVLCKQVEQATTDTDGHLGFSATLQTTVPARTQSWTYNQWGQVLSEDGPRTDVNDVTTYTYYSDTTADHTMGDLQSVTNAAGKVSNYSKYNRHGQLLESTDPNGVLSVNTYDLRQRLLSSTVGGQTTSYSYDPAGQLKKVTLPDASWVGYDYDAAHRQIAVYDHKGNRTEYQLDNAGNRTGETTKDPNGALKRQLSRSIDALGRVQQTTGRE